MNHRRMDSQRWRLITACVEQAEMGVLISDMDGLIAYANPAFERITGLSVARLRRRRLGARALLRLNEAVFMEIRETVGEGGTWRGRLRARRPGGEPYWLGLTVVPLRQAGNRVTHAVAYMRDITDQVRLEHRVAQSRRLEVVERMAAGVAHDLNNLLGAIQSLTELVEMKIPEGDPAREEMHEIVEATEMGGRLTRQLLALARGREESREAVDLNVLVRGLEPMLRRVLEGHGIHLVLRTATHVPPVNGNPAQFEQVLLNLVFNARDATPRGGHVTIRTGTDTSGEHRSPGDGRERWAILEVSDTGTGMTEEVLDRLFEPFYTTKEPGKGTGLGLAVCREIVSRAGGWISVDSTVGRGTTVRVCLPPAPDPELQPETGVSDAARASRGILVVEPDRRARTTLSRRLRGLGWYVLEADDPDQALDLWRDHDPRIGTVVVSGSIAGTPGMKLASQLRRLDPDLRVVLMTDSAPPEAGPPPAENTHTVVPSADPEETADAVCRVVQGPTESREAVS